jgi:hypothetical protein
MGADAGALRAQPVRRFQEAPRPAQALHIQQQVAYSARPEEVQQRRRLLQRLTASERRRGALQHPDLRVRRRVLDPEQLDPTAGDEGARVRHAPAVDRVHRDGARLGVGLPDDAQAREVLSDALARAHLNQPVPLVPPAPGFRRQFRRGRVQEEAAGVGGERRPRRLAAPEIGAGQSGPPADQVPGGQAERAGRRLPLAAGRAGQARLDPLDPD